MIESDFYRGGADKGQSAHESDNAALMKKDLCYEKKWAGHSKNRQNKKKITD